MPDYKKLYLSLFNDVTDIIEELKKIQKASEERYLTSCEKDDDSQRDAPFVVRTVSPDFKHKA